MEQKLLTTEPSFHSPFKTNVSMKPVSNQERSQCFALPRVGVKNSKIGSELPTFIHCQDFSGISASQISDSFTISSFCLLGQILSRSKNNS